MRKRNRGLGILGTMSRIGAADCFRDLRKAIEKKKRDYYRAEGYSGSELNEMMSRKAGSFSLGREWVKQFVDERMGESADVA